MRWRAVRRESSVMEKGGGEGGRVMPAEGAAVFEDGTQGGGVFALVDLVRGVGP
ncbi:MAG: hypothetical protein KF712_07120 [Akkermansiaceae bacterium]|nr:hypothetical protein [Akkermansiaceae bacterium]